MYIYLHFSTCFLIHFSRGAGRQMGVYPENFTTFSRRFLFSSKVLLFMLQWSTWTGHLGKRNSCTLQMPVILGDSTYNWKPLVSPTEIAKKFPKSAVVLCIPRHDFRKLYFWGFFIIILFSAKIKIKNKNKKQILHSSWPYTVRS
jgi:hypothetical protein